jgi:hypothetical protein
MELAVSRRTLPAAAGWTGSSIPGAAFAAFRQGDGIAELTYRPGTDCEVRCQEKNPPGSCMTTFRT